jgi:hypothetical protein
MTAIEAITVSLENVRVPMPDREATTRVQVTEKGRISGQRKS